MSFDELVKKADSGDANAQYELSEIFFKLVQEPGKAGDLKQNMDSTLKYCKGAADQGHTEAQFKMGLYTLTIFKDGKTSKGYFEKAARKGHMDAQEMLDSL